jgi:phosphate-selective porin OprO/OprP
VFGWNVGNGEYDCTGRFTCLPVYAHEGRCLVHLGIGASFRDPDEDRFRQRARTMLRNGPAALHTALVNTEFLTTRQILVVPEFAMVWGPFSLVAEYYANWFQNTNYQKGGVPFEGGDTFASTGNVGTTFYHGFYVEALWFLTGEHRPYNKYGGSGAAFGRVIPFRPYYFVPGEGRHLFSSGAWQVAARYQWIDLEDKNVPGGILQDVTLGLNWFLNPNLKFQWNYTITHRDYTGDAADGDVQGFGMRVAWDF